MKDFMEWLSHYEPMFKGIAALIGTVALVTATLTKAFRGLSDLVRRRRQPALPSSIPSPAPTMPNSERLLAVLAFDNLSNDPEMQFFSDGISEELIQRLSRGAALKVIGRTSSFQFRGERKAEAAAQLGCTHVLDGSIRRDGGRARISAHLSEAASRTTLWSERYDRTLDDIFAVQDQIAASIANALDHAFVGSTRTAIAPAIYDSFLRTSPKSYAPEELRTKVGMLDVICTQAPDFGEAWGRLAYLRAWLHFYEPFKQRPESALAVARAATRALELDPQNIDALTAQVFVLPPFGAFVEFGRALDSLRGAPGAGDGKRIIGWLLRNTGQVKESLAETERAYRLDPLDTMMQNMVALARMAAGRISEAVPVYEMLVESVPSMTFPISSLLRAHAFLEDWTSVERLMKVARDRNLNEFEDGLAFVRTKRSPTRENLAAWQTALDTVVQKNGSVDISRLVYTAHLGLVDEAYRIAASCRLGPTGAREDIMGPDGYRTSLLFQANMPELRNDPRFVTLCARLGLVEYWTATNQWPDCADEVPYDFRRACFDSRDIPKEGSGAGLATVTAT